MSVFVDIVPDESQVDSPPEGAAKNRWRGPLTKAALPLLSVVVFLGAWQLAASAGIWNQTFVPYPSTVWKAFVDVSTTHDGVRGYAGYLLWEHLYMTLRRVFVGVVIGVTLGVLLGLVMGSIGWVRKVLLSLKTPRATIRYSVAPAMAANPCTRPNMSKASRLRPAQ